MQFNPACVSGGHNSNLGLGLLPEYLNIPTFTEAPSNSWTASLINSLQPVYGLYNTNIATTPPGTPIQNTEVPSPQDTDGAKKKSKRAAPLKEEPPKIDDKFQGLDEEQKQKRQRRLMKNREAAQQFRIRQKEYIQNLERRVTELNTHVGETHKHIELLTTENRLLRDQLVYLYNVMRQTSALTSSPSPYTPGASPITSLPAAPPAAAIDLGMLGFKGFGVLDNGVSFEEILKSSTPSLPHFAQTPALTPVVTPAATPVSSAAPSPASSPTLTPALTPAMAGMISPRIPDMGTLTLGKGLELDEANALLISRFGNLIKTDHNEAQTVPELMIKPEGGGNM